MNKFYLFFVLVFLSSCLSKEERTILNDLNVDKDRISITKLSGEYIKNDPLIKRDLEKIDSALYNIGFKDDTFGVLSSSRPLETSIKISRLQTKYVSKINRARGAEKKKLGGYRDTLDLIQVFHSRVDTLESSLYNYYNVGHPVDIRGFMNLYLVEVKDSITVVYDLDYDNKKIEKKTIVKQ